MFKGKKIIALICCREGSKGIPKKNIKEFHGKPLLGWILEASKEANVFDDIILSTDSEEIAGVGKHFGATVPFMRPSHLAQDDSDQFEAHRHAFETLGIKDLTHRVCNLTNNPFINKDLIKEGYKKSTLFDFKYIVLDTVKLGGDYTYFRNCYLRNGILKLKFPDHFLKSSINRQNTEDLYTTINNMRWGKPSVLSSYENYKQNIIENGIIPVWLPKKMNFDLDDMDDWEIAEAVFQKIFL